MSSSSHRHNNVDEFLKVISLDSQLVLLKERNDPLEELDGAVIPGKSAEFANHRFSLQGRSDGWTLKSILPHQ